MGDSDGADTGAATEQNRPPPLPLRTLVLWAAGITAVILIPVVVTGPFPVPVLPLLIFLPAFAAGVGTLWQTAGASAWVLFVTPASLAYHGELLDYPVTLVFTAGLCGLSVVAARYRIRREEEISRLRSTAAEMQRHILRPFPLRTGQLLVEGLYRPVETESMVGGDVYEVATSPWGTRVLIADVQGKGLPALGAAFAVLGAFRSSAPREPELLRVVEAMEDVTAQYNTFAPQSEEPERFVTALVIEVDDGPWVRAVDCGHIPPHLLASGRTGGAVPLTDPGIPLGLGYLSARPRTVQRFELAAGEALLLCTDGVTEARSAEGDFYPLDQRLRSWEHSDPRRLLSALQDDLYRFTGGDLRDDIAVLVLRREPRTSRSTRAEDSAA